MGVASLIIALAITNGMSRDLHERLLSSTAHVDLMRVQSDGIRNWRALTDRLRHLPHVTAAAPGLYEPVLVSRGALSGGAMLKGIVPAEERTVSDLLTNIWQGRAAHATVCGLTTLTMSTGTPTPPLVIGYDLANTLDAKVGDHGNRHQPTGRIDALRDGSEVSAFSRLSGIFRLGLLSVRFELRVYPAGGCAAPLR